MSDPTSNFFQGHDILITGGAFHQTNNFMKGLAHSAFRSKSSGLSVASEPALELLQKYIAPAAMHDSGESFEKPKCHPNTRVAVLRRLTGWIFGDFERDKSIMWLYGDAGAGKSTIAQTLAQQCSSTGHLLASFAFSRNDNTRSTHTSLASTIAYQMATSVPELRTLIAASVERDPIVFDKSLEVQFKSLVISPVNNLSRLTEFTPDSTPHLLIVDGLDECSDPRIHVRILEVLSEAMKQCAVTFKVLLTSRPEVNISTAFNHDPVASLSTRLALDASFKPDDDIRLVFESAFRDIKARHCASGSIPAPWPGDNTITQLVRKASGQFIYASTVTNYISSSDHHPVERLEIVLGIQPPTSDKDLPFATLDALFTYIFSSIPVEYIEDVLNILACQMYASRGRPASLETRYIFHFLFLDQRKTGLYLGYLSSILKWQSYCGDGEMNYLTFTHASVTDFLSDHQRSGRFYIDNAVFLSKVAYICVSHVNEGEECPTSVTSLGNLKYLLRNLSPTLRRNLLSSPLPPFSENASQTSVREIMQILRGKPDAQDIYVHHFANFDQFMLSRMTKEEMHPNEGKTLKVALLGLSNDSPGIDNFEVDWRDGLFGDNLFFWYSWDQEKRQAQEGVLVDFCDDPLRSKEFVRTGATYAAAALDGFNQIFSEDSPKFSSWSAPRTFDPDDAPAWRFVSFVNTACYYLPQLLDRASHSPELVAVIQSGKFQHTYGKNVFPEKHSNASHLYDRALIVQVVRAADAYLERVTGPIPRVKKWATRMLGWD